MEKLELNLEVLLPSLPHSDDACVKRIQEKLSQLRGVTDVHIEQKATQAIVCLHYDASVTTLASLQRLTAQTGAELTTRYQHEIITILGMDCSDCTLAIEHTLKRLDGVLNAAVSYAAGTLLVEYDSSKISRSIIIRRLSSLGYRVQKNGVAALIEDKRELLFVFLSGVFLCLGWLSHSTVPQSTLFLYIFAYLFGGWDVAHHAWSSLRQRHFDTDLLMIAAALGAAVIGDLPEGALLLFLFSLGHALEEMALDRARDAVRQLGQLTPKTALVRRDKQEQEVPVEQLKLDDVVIVRPGARLAADGIIISGTSSIDQASVTGESVPVDKTPGEKVFAGTVNGEGVLEIKVSRLSKDNTLSRVMQLVEEAQSQKTNTQQLTEKFTSWFVPAIFISDSIFLVVQLLFGLPFHIAFLHSMTVLVAASPCALALGAPSAMLTAIARAAANGVLVKGGVHLENLGLVDTVAFDKTGTLTVGKPEVVDLLLADPSFSADQILAIAAAVEGRSGHPLAQAVVRAAQARSLSLPEVGSLTSVTGKGLRSTFETKPVLIGNLRLIQESGIALASAFLEQVNQLEKEGKTTVLIAISDQIAGVIALADTPRANAKETIALLKRLGIRQTLLLTGDNERVANTIAGAVGIDAVRAQLLPEDKVTALRELSSGHTVAMVGDGVNDAPALAAASVGVAMGGAATDVALETADVALMNDDLSKLPFAIGLGRATRAVVMQNLFLSGAVIILLLAASLLGVTSIAAAVVIHEGSTIAVISNSLRLLRYKLPKDHLA